MLAQTALRSGNLAQIGEYLSVALGSEGARQERDFLRNMHLAIAGATHRPAALSA